jgi:hypothetical protein
MHALSRVRTAKHMQMQLNSPGDGASIHMFRIPTLHCNIYISFEVCPLMDPNSDTSTSRKGGEALSRREGHGQNGAVRA